MFESAHGNSDVYDVRSVRETVVIMTSVNLAAKTKCNRHWINAAKKASEYFVARSLSCIHKCKSSPSK